MEYYSAKKKREKKNPLLVQRATLMNLKNMLSERSLSQQGLSLCFHFHGIQIQVKLTFGDRGQIVVGEGG